MCFSQLVNQQQLTTDNHFFLLFLALVYEVLCLSFLILLHLLASCNANIQLNMAENPSEDLPSYTHFLAVTISHSLSHDTPSSCDVSCSVGAITVLTLATLHHLSH
jgi:hypothetical protein